jgi:hypothetical protein
MVNVHSGLCVDVTRYVWEARLIQFPCKGEDSGWFNQLWVIHSNGDLVQFTPYGDHPNPDYRLGSTTPALGVPVKLLYLPDFPDPNRVSWIITEAP